MNLTQVMNVALPEPPAARLHDRFPRVSPKLIARDHYEREGHMVHVIIPDGPSHFFRFSSQQYELIKLFDGRRSYAEIASIFRKEQNISINEEFVRKFADNMEKKEFWYRTPQEESITLFNKLAGDRHKTLQKRKGRSGSDLAIIELIYFDPDKYLAWLYRKIGFVYSDWFNLLAVGMVLVMFGILGSRWEEVWADSVKFYNFTEKSFFDIIEFFLVFAVLGGLHETAHGMTCKHFGGESHKMGAFLMYLMPGVFCDVTQIYIYGGRWQRIKTLFAGIWSEIILCSWVSVLWWLTPIGSYTHDIAYKFILSGGIFVIIINLNPLARMDGYYIFSELTRHFDLKGNSTALLSNTVRKYIFRMPATVAMMPTRQRVFFLVYAFLAGTYSYMLLLFLVKVTYRVMYTYQPEWAFIPASWVAYMIFRSRIYKFMAFIKAFYTDKSAFMLAHWKRLSMGFAVVAVLMSIPVWRESIEERFLLEPAQRAVMRATVPGIVEAVLADEGKHVAAGQRVALLRDLRLESESARVKSDYQQAVARSQQAQLRYVSFGTADQERQRLLQKQQSLQEQSKRLVIESPIAGTITTPRLSDLAGSYVSEGTLIAEVADTSYMRANIFVPESEIEKLEIEKLQKIDSAVLRFDAFWKPMQVEFETISTTSAELEKGLMPPSKFKGMRPPVYYVVLMKVPNQDGSLRTGMTGTAVVYGKRRSSAGILFRPLIDAVARRLW